MRTVCRIFQNSARAERLQNLKNSSRADRMRELETTVEILVSQIATLQRDRVASALSSLTRAATLAAPQQAVFWDGDGTSFPEQHPGETGASYDIGASRVSATTCYEAGGVRRL